VPGIFPVPAGLFSGFYLDFIFCRSNKELVLMQLRKKAGSLAC
jgi:hypothetical protein